MALPIPTKLEESLVYTLDRLVADGLYQSRSEAIRDAVRRLVERNYVSRIRFLRVIAEISALVILRECSSVITDIVLFGSVASGQISEDSDVDVLVLVSSKGRESPNQLEIRIHEIVYPIALASGTVITPIVFEKRKFVELSRSGEHFTGEIVRRGIPLHVMILDEIRGQSVLLRPLLCKRCACTQGFVSEDT